MVYKRKLELGRSLMHSLPLLRVDVLVIWSKNTLLRSLLLPANGAVGSQEEAKTVEKSSKRISSAVQEGTPAAASFGQPESSTLHLDEYLSCSSLALFPFSGPYLSAMSTKACTDAFTLLPRDCWVSLSSPPATEAHSSAPYTMGKKPNFSPLSLLRLPHRRSAPFPAAGETVGSGSHGTPALWAKLFLLHFERD